ncbi:MAG: hypothetical protein ACYTGQ_11945 [Planctomycetota bacterium]|jgi:hypothetical protein
MATPFKVGFEKETVCYRRIARGDLKNVEQWIEEVEEHAFDPCDWCDFLERALPGRVLAEDLDLFESVRSSKTPLHLRHISIGTTVWGD